MSNKIIVFTDGSSSGNPGPGGWGAVIAYPRKEKDSNETVAWVTELGGRESETTNNRMEIKAAIEALIAIKTIAGDVELYSDSSYLINGITKWVKGWVRNGWITSTKEKVVNRDLWEVLTSLLYYREEQGAIAWNYVAGHSGVVGNERTDEIATAFTYEKKIDLYDGPAENYVRDISSVKVSKEKKAKKDSRKSRSNAVAYSYISKVDGKVQTHKTWTECEKRVKGVSGARFKKALSEDEEKEIIAEYSKAD